MTKRLTGNGRPNSGLVRKTPQLLLLVLREETLYLLKVLIDYFMCFPLKLFGRPLPANPFSC